jgi:drug/metabolite transporter (DMT)-like permease
MSPFTLDRIAPALFVLLWSTGWIAAGYAAKTSDALTFLSLRFALAAMAMGAIALATRAVWPTSARAILFAAISGVLLHALYLGPLWWAVRHGLPASISGLLAAIQPILTAALAPILIGERITGRQWLGVLAGLAGLALVLEPKLVGVDAEALRAASLPIAVNVFGMFVVTLGYFFQKKFLAAGDLRATATIQYVAASGAMFLAALALGERRIGWDMQTALTMAWSVLVLSVGAVGLLLMLIRRGAVARSAALNYLVPPAVAIEAWLLFGETLAPLQLVGMALTVLGVMLATPRAQR